MTQQQLQDSANTTPQEVYPPMAQGVFQGNKPLWQQASKTANILGGATAVISAPAVAGGTGLVSAGEAGIDAVIQTGQSLMYNPSVMNFVTDSISGAAPLTSAPASWGGLFGLTVVGPLLEDWWDQ
jgi:hypothetical protein